LLLRQDAAPVPRPLAEQLGNASRFQSGGGDANLAEVKMKRRSKPSFVEGEVLPSDAPLLETPLGRENDFGAADENTLNQDELERPEVLSRPRSEITGRHDEGSGANETVDGLDEYQEAARQGAEDIPVSERDTEFERLPVFDRAESEPKV
jgi:hypothetical protein